MRARRHALDFGALHLQQEALEDGRGWRWKTSSSRTSSRSRTIWKCASMTIGGPGLRRQQAVGQYLHYQ
jgi:hypothetical protein